MFNLKLCHPAPTAELLYNVKILNFKQFIYSVLTTK